MPGHSTQMFRARAVVTSSSSTWVPLKMVGNNRTSFSRDPLLTIVMSIGAFAYRGERALGIDFDHVLTEEAVEWTTGTEAAGLI